MMVRLPYTIVAMNRYLDIRDKWQYYFLSNNIGKPAFIISVLIHMIKTPKVTGISQSIVINGYICGVARPAGRVRRAERWPMRAKCILKWVLSHYFSCFYVNASMMHLQTC